MRIDQIWRMQPGQYFCLSTKSTKGVWHDRFFPREDLKQVQAYIKNNLDKNIYACLHGFSKPHRLKEYAVEPQLLYADLDSVDPQKIHPRPTFAWRSSPDRYVGVWVTDKPVPEDLNRRFTYYLNADKGGWDHTQVLRVISGSINYKYTSLPKVIDLPSEGLSVNLSEIEALLPKDIKIPVGDRSSIFLKYQKKMPSWLRKELMNGKPTVGARSDMIWKMENELLEIGLSIEEIFSLIKGSAWNKFAGRRNEDNQLMRELEKAVHSHVAPLEKANGYHLTAGNTVVREEIDWFWYPYLARGEITMLEGDPGIGKSYIAQMVGGHIIDGLILPTPRGRFQRKLMGNVIYFDLENSKSSVTIPRLQDNGFKHLENIYFGDEPFTIDDPDAMEKVEKAIQGVRPKLIVFDTIAHFFGGADSYKSTEAMSTAQGFRALAVKYDCSVLLLRHLTKNSNSKALYRGQGSISLAGLARIVLTVGRSPKGDDKVGLAMTKNNLAPFPSALMYSIEATDELTDKSKFSFHDYEDWTSDQLLGPVASQEKEELENAVEWLQGELEGGPVDKDIIINRAEARSIFRNVLMKVVKSLKIVEAKRKWSLP